MSEDDDEVEDEDGQLAAVPRPPPAAKSPPKPKVEKKAKAKSEEKDHICDKCGQRLVLGGHRKPATSKPSARAASNRGADEESRLEGK